MDRIGAFNLAGPPRSVPLFVRLRVLFGGFYNQFGWIFFGFGLIFVWVFTLNADLTSWYHFRGQIETVQGTITEGRKTGMSVGGSDHHDGTPIYANHYSFTTEDGTTYEGVSYATGRRLSQGKSATIEYPAGKPQISRIQGTRRKPVGFFGLMPIIFPAIGLCFMTFGLKKGLKATRLLKTGLLSTGKLISKERTNTQINKQYVYKLTFEFQADDGNTYQATAKSHTPAILEDEPEEPLLYDPLLPSYAVILDDLPGSPRINDTGNIKCKSPAAAILLLLIPLATIFGHGTYLYLRFFN